MHGCSHLCLANIFTPFLKHNWSCLPTNYPSIIMKDKYCSMFLSACACAMLIYGSLLALIFPDVEKRFPINFSLHSPQVLWRARLVWIWLKYSHFDSWYPNIVCTMSQNGPKLTKVYRELVLQPPAKLHLGGWAPINLWSRNAGGCGPINLCQIRVKGQYLPFLSYIR